MLRFGPFALDPERGDLTKEGRPVRLQPQPTRLLALLARRAGQVVTREEIQRELWSGDTFVDYDQSINFCIKRIREVLGDDKETPRFVETVPRRGYRFVASVRDETGGPRARYWTWGLGAAIAVALLTTAALGRRASDVSVLPSTVPFTSELGDESMPDFSPDGRQIAYVWNGGGDGFYHVYAKMVTGGEPLQITSAEASDYHPSWSPDGTQLAFLREAGAGFELMTVSALGGSERFVTATSWMTRPDWHPEGEHLAFGSDEGLELLTLSSGERRMLTFPEDRSYDRGIAFSPDGRQVTFFRQLYGFGGGDLYVQPTEGGEARRLTSVHRPVTGFAWTPDGKSIVFSAPIGRDFRTLWKVPTSGGTPVRLGVGDHAELVAIASDGRLAYDVRNNDLNIWRIPGPAATEHTPPERLIASTWNDGFPAYSPDGTKVAFISNRTGRMELWLAGENGDEATAVGVDAGPAPPRWSPEGDEIAYSAAVVPEGAGVFVVSARGGPARHLTTAERMAFLPAWSPDGAWVFFQVEDEQDRWRVSKVSAAGGSALPVIEGFSREPIASSERLYYLVPRSILWGTPLDGEGAPELVLDERLSILRWTVWNDKIVYINRERPVVQLFDPETGENRDIASLGESPNLGDGFAVSPDGRWILYVQDDAPPGRDIMLVESFDP